MSNLLSACEDQYGTDDLYEVLKIKKKASASEIKRAYHKMSLEVHPDRVEAAEKKTATEKFQTLGKIYAILSDVERRKIYDESGEIDDESYAGKDDKDWHQYWRLLFKEISVKDIIAFEKKYKHSKEEKEDLFAAYNDYDGDMDLIMEHVLCAEIDDEDRFKEMLDAAIKDKLLTKTKKYTSSMSAKRRAARRQNADSEAQEALEMAADLGLGKTDDALAAMIRQKQKARQKENESFFDHLAAKYGAEDDADAPKRKSKKRK